MQPGPGGGDPALGDSQRQRCADPVGETALLRPPPGPRRPPPPSPPTVADAMSRHNRRRENATRAKVDPPPPRPPRGPAPPLTVIHPHAAGIDVHSDMHMVCVPAGSAPPAGTGGD